MIQGGKGTREQKDNAAYLFRMLCFPIVSIWGVGRAFNSLMSLVHNHQVSCPNSPQKQGLQ